MHLRVRENRNENKNRVCLFVCLFSDILTLYMPMWSILHMTVMAIVAVVAPRTGKTNKNGLKK